MILRTKKMLIKGIVEAWKSNYPYPSVPEYQKIRQDLVNTKPTTEDEIEKIIGNRSWTSNECDECKEDVEVVMVVWDKQDDEIATEVYICRKCLVKALEVSK